MQAADQIEKSCMAKSAPTRSKVEEDEDNYKNVQNDFLTEIKNLAALEMRDHIMAIKEIEKIKAQNSMSGEGLSLTSKNVLTNKDNEGSGGGITSKVVSGLSKQFSHGTLPIGTHAHGLSKFA